MELIKDFTFNLDKQHVLEVLETYLPSSGEDRSKIYDTLINELYENIDPIGFFKLIDKPKEYDFESFKECSKIAPCLITLGSRITDKIDNLFNENKFVDAVMLDVMASTLLFEYNSQMYEHIFNYFYNLGFGITCRVAPGDGEIPIEYQSDIIDRLEAAKPYGIYTIKGYAVHPPKSLTYVHGVDEKLEKIKRRHSCRECPNISCSIRAIKEKAKGIF
ncbi:hypothetical protein [Thermobrachium celere]|uniref:hypothetical protein n=1 Tax=Thermobrachium celere TaxID=53422 RepID=UPI00194104D4|nr:hypothetical protein [Thermobrachium celere]GFR36029.1 hypothetical protein TCEA9_18410 [Thermobrachium celere]